jgi:hypothetical protein
MTITHISMLIHIIYNSILCTIIHLYALYIHKYNTHTHTHTYIYGERERGQLELSVWEQYL